MMESVIRSDPLIHLVKLCVGFRDVSELRSHIDSLGVEAGAVVASVTRSFPSRHEELLDGGSLYWVMRGAVRCRQRLVGFDRFKDGNGIDRCQMQLDPQVIETSVAPYKAFQGWRYLEADRAPADVAAGDDLPAHIKAELAELGLV